MDYVSCLNSEGIDYITFIFENCEQIVISTEHIKQLKLEGIQECELWEVSWLDVIIDKQANGYYTTLGYDPKTTSFNRILYRHDIVAMEMHKNTGDRLQLHVMYKENEKGFNNVETTYIDNNHQLHIQIGVRHEKDINCN